MCRDRAWRRYTEERIVIHRLNNKMCTTRWYWRGFEDANGIKHHHPFLSDYIGSTDHFTFKTHTTKRYDTRYKTKYSPNKCKHPYRYKGGTNTREESKLEFLKILRDNGIK
jgi:hypothetical protein